MSCHNFDVTSHHRSLCSNDIFLFISYFYSDAVSPIPRCSDAIHPYDLQPSSQTSGGLVSPIYMHSWYLNNFCLGIRHKKKAKLANILQRAITASINLHAVRWNYIILSGFRLIKSLKTFQRYFGDKGKLKWLLQNAIKSFCSMNDEPYGTFDRRQCFN